MNGIVKMRRNGFAAAGITGKEAVTAYIPLFTADVELNSIFLHGFILLE